MKLQNGQKKIFLALGNLTCNLFVFMGIIEIRIGNNNEGLNKTV